MVNISVFNIQNYLHWSKNFWFSNGVIISSVGWSILYLKKKKSGELRKSASLYLWQQYVTHMIFVLSQFNSNVHKYSVHIGGELWISKFFVICFQIGNYTNWNTLGKFFIPDKNFQLPLLNIREFPFFCIFVLSFGSQTIRTPGTHMISHLSPEILVIPIDTRKVLVSNSTWKPNRGATHRRSQILGQNPDHPSTKEKSF